MFIKLKIMVIKMGFGTGDELVGRVLGIILTDLGYCAECHTKTKIFAKNRLKMITPYCKSCYKAIFDPPGQV